VGTLVKVDFKNVRANYHYQFADVLQCLRVGVAGRAVIHSVWWNDSYLIKDYNVLILPPNFCYPAFQQFHMRFAKFI